MNTDLRDFSANYRSPPDRMSSTFPLAQLGRLGRRTAGILAAFESWRTFPVYREKIHGVTRTVLLSTKSSMLMILVNFGLLLKYNTLLVVKIENFKSITSRGSSVPL